MDSFYLSANMSFSSRLDSISAKLCFVMEGLTSVQVSELFNIRMRQGKMMSM